MIRKSEIGRFLGIPYKGECYPGKVPVEKFRDGSNCQLFVLGVLDEIGFQIGPTMRSSELWSDIEFTGFAGSDLEYLKIFDVLFFLPNRGISLNVKKLHVAIYIGEVEGFNSHHCVLHNPKPGPSAIWPFEYFIESKKKYRFFGAKRPLRFKATR